MDLILLELILVLTVALGLGFWQLHDVNKEIEKDKQKEERAGKQRENDCSEE